MNRPPLLAIDAPKNCLDLSSSPALPVCVCVCVCVCVYVCVCVCVCVGVYGCYYMHAYTCDAIRIIHVLDDTACTH